MRITCVGAGPAGLYFAILAKLRKPTWDISVCERASEETNQGWGVTFLPSLLQKLYDNDAESAQEIDKATFRWRDQFVDIQGERVVYDGGVDVYNLNRPRLVKILTGRARQLGVMVHHDREVTDPGQLSEADLIVAADGTGSQLRASSGDFGTEINASGDKHIWLGTDCPFRAFAYHFLQTDHGWIWANSYGIESELSTFVVQCSSTTWRGLGFDTMPMADALDLLKELYREQLGEHRLMGQADDACKARWQSFRTVTNRRWYRGPVVLLGDSAHTTHFSAGEGTTLAIEDAIALAAQLGRHGDHYRALVAYERQRQSEIRRLQRQAELSARFMANVSYYTNLEPIKFATLLHGRRSRLAHVLPPCLYYQLRKRSRDAPFLRQVRPAVKALRQLL